MRDIGQNYVLMQLIEEETHHNCCRDSKKCLSEASTSDDSFEAINVECQKLVEATEFSKTLAFKN